MKPAVIYFPVRAVGESIRLTLAAAGVDFENEAVGDPAGMKADLAAYPFGQCPRYRNADIDLTQSHAILRHLARKHNLYGAGPLEAARIDQLLDGMGELKGKIVPLVYVDAQSGEEAKAAYWRERVEREAAPGSRGAHLAYLDAFIAAHGRDGWAVGGQLTVADCFLFDLVDLHITKFGAEALGQVYPALLAHHAKIAALPAIAAYLASPLRLPK